MCVSEVEFCPCCKIFNLNNLNVLSVCSNRTCIEITYKVFPLKECDFCVMLCSNDSTCERIRRIPKMLVHNKATDIWVVSFY